MLNKLYNSIFFEPLYFLLRIFFRIKEYSIKYNYKKRTNPTVSLETIRDYNKHRTTGPEKIICHAPFKHMYFKQNGKVTACCATSMNEYGNIRDNSIIDIWKGQNVVDLRNRIENYNLSGACSGCSYSLASKNYNAFIGRIYDDLLPQKKIDYPTEMTFEISNTCNLECVMCNGEFSNLIRKNVEKLPEIPNYYDENFFDEIKEFLPYLKRVRFMGGEPFLIKQYEPIMDFLVKENPNCKIYIQTNGTILNNAVKQIIESKNVELSISVDSLQKETYEKIRKNGNFERTMQNLTYFSRRASENHQLININFCIMNLNWKEVPEIVLFCEKNNFTLNLIPVENPRSYSLRILDTENLVAILQFSQSYLQNFKSSILRDIYNGYLSHLNFLIESSMEKKIRNQELLSLSYEQIYEKTLSIFSSLHHSIPKEDISLILGNAIKILDDISIDDKKVILVNLILDIERVNTLTEHISDISSEELQSKTNVLLLQMKDELFNFAE